MTKNNFDFLRFVFALLVVVQHAYPLSGDTIASQWIYQWTDGQIDFSSIGLNGFFIISGYLIFQSLERSKSPGDYFWKRFLRLFPGLFVVLLLTILLAPFVYESTVPYLSNREVFTYLPKNISLYQLQYNIKGVFENNPHRWAINGSLWTICYEFTMYVLLSLLFFLRKNTKLVRGILALSLITMFAAYNLALPQAEKIIVMQMHGDNFLNLGTFFICGSLLASLKFENIPHKKYIIAGLALLLWISIHFGFYNSTKHILLTMFTLLVGLYALPFFSTFGKTGDMSYGIYIYGFPIQQTLMYFFRLNVNELLLASVLLSMVFGYFSWHLIEKRALRFKNRNFFLNNVAS
jgi:peptidoglycan/LPS O-acetylase OafA/YrhL